MMLHRLLYISTARGPVDQAGLDRILAAARENNRRNGLTGMLLFDGRRFLQYIEGPESALKQTFARIKSDPRHFAIVTLRENKGEERQFADWQMASLAGLSGAEFDAQVRRICTLVENADILTAAEMQGFARKMAA